MATSVRHLIKEMEVIVADVIRETHDTTTLVLFTGNDRLEYRAGHFLTIDPHQFASLERFTAFFEDIKGRREPARAYSMCSAPHETRLAVTVKEERYVKGVTKYPPLLSPYLVHGLKPGSRLVVTGFTGPYTLPEDISSMTDHLVHLCAGSGSVPNLSILKWALEFEPRLRHTFIYSNKTWADVIFRHQLADLERQHPERVRVHHVISREAIDPGERVRGGRVHADLLREWIPDPDACVVFACGPAVSVHDRVLAKERNEKPAPRFMETALDALHEIGVPPARIRKESYG